MASSKKPQKKTSTGKPTGKKAAPKKRPNSAKKTAKRAPAKKQTDAATMTVRYIAANGDAAKNFTWASKAWSSAAQVGDPAAKVLRKFVDKTVKVGKEIRLPEDVSRRIFDTIEFRWYQNEAKNPEQNTKTVEKTPKPSRKSPAKAKTVKPKTAKKTVAKKTVTKRPPRKGQ